LYRKICDEKAATLKSPRNWIASLSYLELFTGGKLLFSDVTTDFVQDYQSFMKNGNAFEARTRMGKFNVKAEKLRKLSPNSIKIYLQLFSSVVKKAIKKKHLLNNPLDGVEKSAGIKPQKEFLTLPELKLLAETKVDIPDRVRRASLFAALTGLRFSDIQQLKWSLGRAFCPGTGSR
jgi:integrase